jgi:hypothetical protein
MNKELIQKLFSKSCWDEQAEVDIEDFISVEKFAELIVRECADVVKYYYIRGGEPITPQHITRHFGVEQ